jgi:hypothetical protein
VLNSAAGVHLREQVVLCEGVAMTAVDVVGLSADGSHLVLRVDGQTVEVPLEDIRRAERRGLAPVPPAEPLTPKLIQHRIRCGESAKEVALAGGWPVDVVARYEGPPLAEREHHATQARRSEVEGRLVEDLVAGHLGQPAEALEWDSWLVEDGRWEVRAAAAGQTVRLRWDPAGRRVQALDEPARRALRVAALDHDTLTAVLRPVSGGGGAAPPPSPRTGRRTRAQVPDWNDIQHQVTGREQD